jgi:hypothetical protein
MHQDQRTIKIQPSPTPWNKGKLIGAKPPIRAKHVWSIRTKLQIEGRVRDLAMFNLALDSKLRDCGVVNQGQGVCSARTGRRSRDSASEEDRTAGKVRVDRADP